MVFFTDQANIPRIGGIAGFMNITILVAVFIGGLTGGLLRHAISNWIGSRTDAHIPWSILWVNVSGAFVAGAVWAVLGGTMPEHGWAATLAIFIFSVLGGYTTVSSFALNTLELARTGRRFSAIANVVVTLCLCMGSVLTGYFAVNKMLFF